MNRRLRTLSLCLLASCSTMFAQQDPAGTHSMYTRMNFNPAAAGAGKGFCSSLIYRNQWDKVSGAPNTVFFNAEANLDRFIRDFGVGIGIIHDAIGFNRQNNANLNVSYKIRFPNGGFLSVGLGAGIANVGSNPIWITPDSPSDPILPVSFNATGLDLNAGLLYQTKKSYVGISSTHLSQSILQSPTSAFQSYTVNRHYYLMAGTREAVVPGKVDIEISTMLRTDLNKFSGDVALRTFINNRIYGGLGYRISDAVLLLLGMEVIPNLTIGYSYDITVNRLANISWGTHEIMLRYCRPIPIPPPTIHRNPRIL